METTPLVTVQIAGVDDVTHFAPSLVVDKTGVYETDVAVAGRFEIDTLVEAPDTVTDCTEPTAAG